MTDDDDARMAALFRGAPGTVLGAHSTPSEDTSATKAKKKAAAEKRLPPRRERGRRVPPGQEIVTDWPVLDLGQQPHIDPADWRLDIKGAVAQPISLDWAMYQTLATDRVDADIHCVTAWSMLDNVWEGLRIQRLLENVQPTVRAKHVVLHAHDGYRTNLPLARFAAEDSLLAYRRNSQSISREHGGPVRVVVPSLYFWKSAKWVRQITILEQDVKGYWEALGYHNEGDPWKEQRYE